VKGVPGRNLVYESSAGSGDEVKGRFYRELMRLKVISFRLNTRGELQGAGDLVSLFLVVHFDLRKLSFFVVGKARPLAGRPGMYLKRCDRPMKEPGRGAVDFLIWNICEA